MKRNILVITLIALALLAFTACEEAVEEPTEPDEVTLPDELPAEVQAWIESRLDQFAGQTLEYDGVLYLLVTYGEKPTGGYDVEITDISEEDGKLVVTAEFTEPGEDDVVTQALTYPYDLAMVDDPGIPVRFVATGAETEINTVE